MYFVANKPKAKLDRFLMYFQRYLFCRGFVPPSTEMDVSRLFAWPRPQGVLLAFDFP
jgi:hypothetical protein